MLIGIDTGGTFTDFVAFDPAAGELRVAKVPSDPAHPQAVLDLGMGRAGAELKEAVRTVHGTTLVTNMVIQGDGARVATVTTRGFRDLLEIGYQNRFEMYDLRTTKGAVPVATSVALRDHRTHAPRRHGPSGSRPRRARRADRPARGGGRRGGRGGLPVRIRRELHARARR